MKKMLLAIVCMSIFSLHAVDDQNGIAEGGSGDSVVHYYLEKTKQHKWKIFGGVAAAAALYTLGSKPSNIDVEEASALLKLGKEL